MKLSWKFVIASIIIIIGLIGYSVIQHESINRLKTELNITYANNKAYENENAILKSSNREFQLTVDQLNYSTDSLVLELNKLRKQLNIKDKNIKELEYIASTTKKVDTIAFRDTLFLKPDLQLDTTVSDLWSTLKLHLEYPNLVMADYSFKNETIVISSSKKEYVNPPKKYWICRLFQRKHIITEVEVIQNNPYAEKGTERFIKILD